MEIEKLNKFQIVLLTLLISFVTSIATGIVTVSLMEQAPPVIPQTINRVVERTVERVVPRDTQTATVITTEKTVVVKESDLIVQAIARIRPSVVRIHTAVSEGKPGDFVSRGFIIAEGYAVASIKNASIDGTFVVLIGEDTVPAKVIKIDSGNNIALLALAEDKEKRAPAATVSTDLVTLGQTVIAITGNTNPKVATGIVTEVNESKAETGESVQTSFETDIPDDSLTVGSPILNTDGAVIGMFNETHIISTSIFTTLTKSLKPAETKTGSGATTTKSS